MRDLDAVFAGGGLLAQSLEGFVPREGQRTMARVVRDAIRHGGVALIEAGTGTGKSFGYMVPALLSGKRVVVSTGTRALQDQLLERDVPALERALGERLPVATLKGLGNYVCRRVAEDLLATRNDLTRPELVRHLPLLVRHLAEPTTLELTRALPEEAPLVSLVRARPETRLGPRCRHFESCFVTQARREAEKARVILVNHHLYFADLALRARGANVLPEYDAVVFDEAHVLADVIAEHHGVSLHPGVFDRLLTDIEGTLSTHRVKSMTSEALLREVAIAVSDLFDATSALVAAREQRLALDHDARERLREPLFELDLCLESLTSHIREVTASLEDPPLHLTRRIDDLRNDALSFTEGGTGMVAWAELRGREPHLGSTPVEVASIFRREVLGKVPSVVLTSATLTGHDGFTLLRRELGIRAEVDELVVPSPFDFATNAALYVPDLPDPRDAGHFGLACEEIRALVEASRGGAFILTTSLRAMHHYAARLGPVFRAHGLEVFVQGDRPKASLVEVFRAGERNVLFGTLGFWEGIDVQGSALRLVVLDRIPFDVPTDPVLEARSRAIEAAEGSPFFELLLPSAARMLKQGFGRLIRHETDRGLVALLDGRLRTKGYGKLLLKSLPPARRVEREQALTFLTTLAR